MEIQRFSGDGSIIDVIGFVGRNADYSEAEWESTRKIIESKKSSNLARLLESAAGRKHLGISNLPNSNGKIPVLESDPIWAIKVLRRIINDVRDGVVDSRDLNKSSDIEDYFNNLPSELQPQGGHLQNPRPFRDINIKNVAHSPATPKKNPKQKTKSAPKPRVTLAPKRHPFHAPKSTKGEMLLREAGDIDADRFRISAAFVLRSFIELAINDYMDTNKISKHEINDKGNKIELDLSQKSDRVLKHIVSLDTSKNADLRGFRNKIITKTSITSIQSLNGFVHNKFQIPTPDDLRTGWDCSVPVFIAAYGVV